MNIVTISNFDQFNLIINGPLCLSGDQSEEIYHNMWCIALEDDFIESIKIQELEHFISNLIENREQQFKHINYKKNAVFYMWFDQQALQLRFNVITGDIKSLPFGCKVSLINSYKTILNNFINTIREVAQCGDRIEFFDMQDENWDEDENEEEYVLDVFIKTLHRN